ncbi:hypothetical protein ABZT26_24785 [Streptomyces sp. NPDC005395]|nr:hypothetical protein [Streptomyces sp. SID10362]
MNTIKVEAADDDDGFDNGQTMAVVYDPRAGLLTGLGTVDGASRASATAGHRRPAG